MKEQVLDNAAALRLFFTDDIYLVASEEPLQVEKISLVPEVPIKKDYKHLGKNQKNVLIIVHDQDQEVSTEQGRELLRNIVKSIQLSATDFALVNYAGYPQTSLEELITYFSSKLVLVFGVTTGQLSVPEVQKNSLSSAGETTLIFADNLDTLSQDQQAKKALWTSLKLLKI